MRIQPLSLAPVRLRRLALGAGLLALAAGAACAARAPVAAASGSTDPQAPHGEGGEASAGGAPRFLYVCNQDAASVSVVDMESNAVVATVDLRALGFSERAQPHDAAVEPDGSYWYVSLIGDGVVLKLDRENRLVGRAPFETPGMLALDGERDRLFVGRSMKAVNPPPRIGEIERSGMEIEEMEVLIPRPHGLALEPAGGRVYAGSMSVNQVATLYVETGEVELTAMPGPHDMLMHMDLSPDGRFLVGTSDHADRMYVLDATAPQPHLVATVELEGAPWEPAFTPDGRHVYVALKRADAVAVVEATGWRVVEMIRGEGLAEPQGVAMSPDGRRVYVSNNNLSGEYRPAGRSEAGPAPGTVVVIDAATRRIAGVLEVGANPTGLGAPRPS